MMTSPHPFRHRLSLRVLTFFGIISVLLLSACDQANFIPTNPSSTPQPEIQPILFGAYTRGNINLDMAAVTSLEQDLDHQLDIVQWFTDFDHPWEPKAVATASANGRIPMITWQPNDHPLANIIAGEEDNYLKRWARGAKAYGGAVYIRLMPEMNGDWVAWSGDPEAYKKAWKHIVDVFRAEGANNVKWIWAPNCVDEPKTDPNFFMEAYYPGGDYVDVIGLSGFNWGTLKDYHRWRTYEQIFTTPYDRVTKLGSHDVWIVETASTELGGNKATWIKAMFSSTAFPKTKAIIWFNESKETDWRVQSSEASLEAFKGILDQTEVGREMLVVNYLK
jgi:mannan endo-1,4-beta-mannosidase